jgi:hypothetical protein
MILNLMPNQSSKGAPGVGEAVDAFFGAASTGVQGVLDGFKVEFKALRSNASPTDIFIYLFRQL